MLSSNNNFIFKLFPSSWIVFSRKNKSQIIGIDVNCTNQDLITKFNLFCRNVSMYGENYQKMLFQRSPKIYYSKKQALIKRQKIIQKYDNYHRTSSLLETNIKVDDCDENGNELFDRSAKKYCGIYGLLRYLGLNYHHNAHPQQSFPFAVKYLCSIKECANCYKKRYKMKACQINGNKMYFCNVVCQRQKWERLKSDAF